MSRLCVRVRACVCVALLQVFISGLSRRLPLGAAALNRISSGVSVRGESPRCPLHPGIYAAAEARLFLRNVRNFLMWPVSAHYRHHCCCADADDVFKLAFEGGGSGGGGGYIAGGCCLVIFHLIFVSFHVKRSSSARKKLQMKWFLFE